MTSHHRTSRRPIILALGILMALQIGVLPAQAHPGSGIAVDRTGQVYFIDTGDGLWKIDLQGHLVHLGGPRFHWMALDLENKFAKTTLPSGPSGDITRVGDNPAVLVSSDFPIAIAPDGNLYYPSRGPAGQVQIVQFTPAGRQSILVTLPANGTDGKPLHYINGLTAATDGSLYFTENSAVRRITPAAQVSTVIADVHLPKCSAIPGMSASDNPFFRGLAVNTAGTVSVAASGCGAVIDVSRDGHVITRNQIEGPYSPTAVAFFGGNVYALEYLHTKEETSTSRRDWVPRVRKIAAGGTSTIIANVERH